MSQTQVDKEKREEKKKEEKKEEEKITHIGKERVLSLPLMRGVFQKIVRFKKIKAFLPIRPPRLKLRKFLLSKLTVKPSISTVSKIIQPPYISLKRVLKIKIPISQFFSMHSEKLTSTIIPLVPPIQMRVPSVRSFHVNLSKLTQEPRLKSHLMVIPRSRVLLNKPIKIQTTLPILPEMLRKKVPVTYEPHVPKEAVTEIEIVETMPTKEGGGLGLFDLLFETETEEHKINNVLRASPERPILIVAEKTESEEYLETLKYVCKELYRIKVGGLPKPIVISVDKRRAEEDAEAGRYITVIDDTKGEFFKLFGVSKDEELKKGINLQKFKDKIKELFAQPFGFLILHVASERLNTVITNCLYIHELIPKLYIVKLKKLALDAKKRLASAAWGFTGLEHIQDISLDKHFPLCEKKFYNALEKLVANPKYSWVRESVEDEESSGIESFLHYSIKVFVIRCLEEELKEELGKKKISAKELTAEVLTEVQLKINDRVVIPDIHLQPNRVIEIETLYGTGTAPWRKLRRTVEKYRDSNYTIQIVIPNLQAMLYVRGIRRLRAEFEEEKLPVEFYTLDIKNKRLVPIDKISKYYGQKGVSWNKVI